MRALRLAMVIALVGGIVGVAAGCGGSDADQARTPTDAPTITNGQPPTETTGGEDEGGGEGDAEAGKVSFENACQGCHPAGGTQAGAGPVLVDRGLAADAIRTQIVNGKGAMPPNLVSGADLDNVVAFVAGLQGEVAAGGGTATGGGGASTDGGGGGDDAAIAAGKTFFEGTCQGCHPAGGTQAGAGPVLASRGLAEDAIRNQIVNGGAVMPAGLATGDDLENVTKFVVSLQ